MGFLDYYGLRCTPDVFMTNRMEVVGCSVLLVLAFDHLHPQL
jgi:hypothetical protein